MDLKQERCSMRNIILLVTLALSFTFSKCIDVPTHTYCIDTSIFELDSNVSMDDFNVSLVVTLD